MDEKFKKYNMSYNFFKKEDLSKYSWFNLGGPAEILFKPDNVEQILSFFKDQKKR